MSCMGSRRHGCGRSFMLRMVRFHMVFGRGSRGLRHVDILHGAYRMADGEMDVHRRQPRRQPAVSAVGLCVRTQHRRASAESVGDSRIGPDMGHEARHPQFLEVVADCCARRAVRRTDTDSDNAQKYLGRRMARTAVCEQARYADAVRCGGVRAVARRFDSGRHGRDTKNGLTPLQPCLLDGQPVPDRVWCIRVGADTRRHTVAGQLRDARRTILVRAVSGPRAIWRGTAFLWIYALQQASVSGGMEARSHTSGVCEICRREET